MKKLKLSALVVAHNEEDHLDACLSALKFADEIVVVLDPKRLTGVTLTCVAPRVTIGALLVNISSIYNQSGLFLSQSWSGNPKYNQQLVFSLGSIVQSMIG